MATYNETFLVTALPDSVQGTKIRVAVLVSPRLTSDTNADAALDNWPDARDWPSINPTWEVTVKQGATTVTRPATEIKAEAYDFASWQQMFPPTSTTMPYVAKDKSKAPIFSYPVKKVLETVRAMHTTVLSGHRSQFPSLDSLQEMSGFQALKRAADPDLADKVMQSQGSGPSPDSARSVAESFAMADIFHGVRPGSLVVPPAPHIDSISPVKSNNSSGGETVEIIGANFTTEAEVHFGDDNPSLKVTFVSSTKLTAEAPGGPANKSVEVVVVIGEQTSNSKSFLYGPQKPK